jgi:hypothetical protein
MKKNNLHPPLPTGCHDAQSAAVVLGMSKIELLKKMRALGWLSTSGDKRNLPRPQYIQHGWLTTQPRSYALSGRPDIVKTYSVMLITEKGMRALAHAIRRPQHATTATRNIKIPRSEDEYKKCRNQLKQLGLLR